MQYGKRPQLNTRHFFGPGPGPKNTAGGTGAGVSNSDNTLNKIEDIPLPNELETTPSPPGSPQSRRKAASRSFLDIIKERISLEEIILLGLIFLLLDEAIEDELLLILLVYILLV